MTSIASWSTPQNPNPMQPLGAPMGGGQQTQAQWQAGRDAWLAAGGQDGPNIMGPRPGAPVPGAMETGGGTPGTVGNLPGGGTISRVPGFPNHNPTGTTGPGAAPWTVQGGQMQSFGPGNDLRGTAIMPGQSETLGQYGQYVQGAAGNVSNFQFSPFQGVQTPTFGQERGMLGGANAQMQGLSLDFTGANNAYGNAVGAQQGAQGQASNILQGLAGMGAGGFGGGGASANTGRFNSELDAALQGLQGPDRAALAADAMKLLEERSNSGFRTAQRETGQRAAALGRLGSGMTTNDLTGVLQSRENLLDRSRRELAMDAAGRTLDDRLNVAGFQRGIANDRFGGEMFNAGLADNAAGRAQQGAMFGANLQRGVAGDLYGMGRDAAGLQMDVGDRFGNQARDVTGLGERAAGFTRNVANDLSGLTRDSATFAQGERDAARSDEFGRAGYGLQALSGLSGIEERQRGFEGGLRDEARGERGFQQGMAQTAQQNAIQQQQFNEWLRNSGWGRVTGAAGAGFGGSPQSAYQQAANNTRSFFG